MVGDDRISFGGLDRVCNRSFTDWCGCRDDKGHRSRDLRAFFSFDENKDLLDKPPNQRLAYFYDLWTLKESFIKAVGKGSMLSG
ncbi:MAG: 4'-phosphopantetheinyl transferase superfamily protein [Paenibacillaceae bacterium]